MKTFALTAALVGFLTLGVNGRGGGGGGRNNGGDDDAADEPGCCYGSDSKCDTSSKSTCDKFASRKGCEWRSGDTADCTPEPAEPGCCYSDDGNSKCDTDDEATCEKNARRGGCEWRVGDEPDLCAIPEPEPGCCFSPTSDAKCNVDDEATCVQNAKRSDCEWRTGFKWDHHDYVTDMWGNRLCPHPDLYFGDGIVDGWKTGEGPSSTWTLSPNGIAVIPAGGQSVSGSDVFCVGGSACTVDADYNTVEVYSDGVVYCFGYMSCNAATIRADGYEIRCAGELSCAGYEHECEGKGEATSIELIGGCSNSLMCGILCDGFRSCAWKDQIFSAGGYIQCHGEESCFGVNSIFGGGITSSGISCEGERSCAGVTELHANTVSCAGFESCADTGFNGLVYPEFDFGGWYSEAECDGSRSCVGSRFADVQSVYFSGFESGVGVSTTGAKTIIAAGANALQGASISVDAFGTSGYPELTLTLIGDGAGSGAKVEHCDGYEICTFGCSGTACRDLEVECGVASTSKCTFVSDSGDDMDCFNHSGEEVFGAYCPIIVESFDAAQRMSAHESESESVAVCDANPINDPYRSEAWKAASPETAVWFCSDSSSCDTTLWSTENRAAMCTGQKSCQYTNFAAQDAISCESDHSCYSSDWWHNGDVGCSGYYSCGYMDYWKTSDADDEMEVRCTGELSCFSAFQSTFASQSVEGFKKAGQSWACRGKKSCKQSQLFNVEVCSAEDACSSTTIGYNGKDLRCSGENACNEAVIAHVDGDVFCAGSESCTETEVRAADALFCDGYLSCSHMTGVHGVPSQIFARGRKALSDCDIQSLDSSGEALELFEVFASSSKALHKTTIKCVEGSECKLYCAGNSCATMQRFECASAESCSCEGDSCPEIVVVTPQAIDGAMLLSPRARAQLKQQRMEAVAVELTETQQALINEPMLMLGGAGVVLMLLGAVFHLYGRKDKNIYEQL